MNFLNNSCRKEEFQSVGTSPERGLEPGSNVADLLLRTTLKDGSPDNIIDQISCFSVKLPVEVVANGTELLIETEEDYGALELVLEESAVDNDTLELVFPITLVFPDYVERTVRTQAELDVLKEECPSNAEDDDIECVDIVYPLNISVYNATSEAIDTISFQNDRALYAFIDDLDENDIVEIQFPVSLILIDGSTLIAFDMTSLEVIITENQDNCSENDENVPTENNCTDCNSNVAADELFTICRYWGFTSLSVNLEPVDIGQTNLILSFDQDGTLTATSDSQTYEGSWNASGSGFIIQIEINMPELEELNRTWSVRKRAFTDGDDQLFLFTINRLLKLRNDCTSMN